MHVGSESKSVDFCASYFCERTRMKRGNIVLKANLASQPLCKDPGSPRVPRPAENHRAGSSEEWGYSLSKQALLEHWVWLENLCCYKIPSESCDLLASLFLDVWGRHLRSLMERWYVRSRWDITPPTSVPCTLVHLTRSIPAEPRTGLSMFPKVSSWH